MQNLMKLVQELTQHSSECEWLEFKRNHHDPHIIGKNISALSNAATLCDRENAYIIWGVTDENQSIVGTDFHPASTKIKGEILENWLLRHLQPKIHLEFRSLRIDGFNVVVLIIPKAWHHPVSFNGEAYVRVGSYTKPLQSLPQKHGALWRKLDPTTFEQQVAAAGLRDQEVLDLLDSSTYFRLLQRPLPQTSEICHALAHEKLIKRSDAGDWSITMLGFLLFARQLSSSKYLERKSLRVIQYQSSDRSQVLREFTHEQGYACALEDLMQRIIDLIPPREHVVRGVRRTVSRYPERALREAIVNALIHQDFSWNGTGPMLEIFPEYLHITNPGLPLITAERFITEAPISRNRDLAHLMRRLGFCEERGSGWNHIMLEIEKHHLPPPSIRTLEISTRVTLFEYRPLARIDRQELIWALYLHACLKYESQNYLTNASVRTRFNIPEHNRALASRMIADAVEAEKIIPYDEKAAPKFKKYLPYWAAPTPGVKRS